MTHKLRILKVGVLAFSLAIASNVMAQSGGRGRGSTRANSGNLSTTYKKGILLDFAYNYTSNNTATSPAQTSDFSSQGSVLDVKLGYINQASFYYGGQYTIKSDIAGTTETTGRGSGFGLGYFWSSGFDLRLYYRFNESYSNFSKGTGYQANLGYSVKLNRSIVIGVLVDYREIRYDAYSLSTPFTSRSVRTIASAVTLGFLID